MVEGDRVTLRQYDDDGYNIAWNNCIQAAINSQEPIYFHRYINDGIEIMIMIKKCQYHQGYNEYWTIKACHVIPPVMEEIW